MRTFKISSLALGIIALVSVVFILILHASGVLWTARLDCSPTSTFPVWSSIRNKCVSCWVASPQRPIWDGTSCTACPAGQHQLGPSCITCPADKPAWNSATLECETCAQVNTKLPLWNGKQKCIACPAGQHWNGWEEDQCVTCSGDAPAWSDEILSCVSCALANPKLPFWNGKKCIACPDAQHWNGTQCTNASGAAVECSGNQYWNGSQCASCPGNQKWNGTKCVCPFKQNWDGSKCTACPSHQHWDGESCVSCPSKHPWTQAQLACACPNTMQRNMANSLCVEPTAKYVQCASLDNFKKGKLVYPSGIACRSGGRVAPGAKGSCLTCPTGSYPAFTH